MYPPAPKPVEQRGKLVSRAEGDESGLTHRMHGQFPAHSYFLFQGEDLVFEKAGCQHCAQQFRSCRAYLRRLGEGHCEPYLRSTVGSLVLAGVGYERRSRLTS